MKLYTPIEWPDVQELMVYPEFNENAYLIDDENGIKEFGSSAYFVNVQWLTKIDPYYGLSTEELKELVDSWEADSRKDEFDYDLPF